MAIIGNDRVKETIEVIVQGIRLSRSIITPPRIMTGVSVWRECQGARREQEMSETKKVMGGTVCMTQQQI